MHYVYVLADPQSGAVYYGFSSNLKRRIKEHETKLHVGWILVYYEAYLDEADARQRERKLKQYGAGRGHLKKRIERSLARALKSAG